MDYIVQATIRHTTPVGTTVVQAPTFILDSAIQGIRNRGDAGAVAMRVLNPTRSPDIVVSLHIEER